ncbi:MAG: hypothetical protein Q9209_005632 [Squamulea sp. 1 TL-2023]
MEELVHAENEDQFDEDDAKDWNSYSQSAYPDPDTVVGNPWLLKAYVPSGSAAGGEGVLHDLEKAPYSRSPLEDITWPTEHGVTAVQDSGSEDLGGRFADPKLVGRADLGSESDFALPEEEAEEDEELLSGLMQSSSDDKQTRPQLVTSKRRSRRDRCTESTRSHGRLARQSKKGIKRGQRKPLEPSNKFKSLHAQATMAFIDADYELAEQLTLQAILLNPEMYAAHSLLSEIHTARGDFDKALVALFNAAHTSHRNPEPWSTIARLILARTDDDDDNSALRDALYCYNRVIEVDPGNFDAHQQRAPLRHKLGHMRRAAEDYEHLLRVDPHDVGVLRSLAAIYTEMDKPQRALELYNQSIDYYRSIETEQPSSFSWSDVNIYVELLAYQQRYAEAIMKLKSLSRWLLGRQNDHSWDSFCEDDREWDLDDHPRRVDVLGFKTGAYPVESYGRGMPLELHVKLGIYRLKSRDRQIEEATTRFELLSPNEPSTKAKLYDYPDLYRDAADALRDTGFHYEALKYYQPLQEIPEFVDALYYADVASCYKALGHEAQAEECCRIIASLERDQYDGRTMSAGLELDVSDKSEATIAGSIEEVATSRAPATLAMLISHRLKRRTRQPDMNKELRAKLQEEMSRALYDRTQELLDQARQGDPEVMAQWMASSQELVNDFQSHRGFYPSDKGLRVYGRPQDAGDTKTDPSFVAGDYRGIPFSSWLDLMLDYAVLAARSQNSAKAYEILKIADDANVFYCSPNSMFLIHVCWFSKIELPFRPLAIAYRHLACALIASDHETSCNVARWFMKEFQFVTDGYRLFSAVNRLCDGGNAWYNCGPSQKYVLRQLKAMDHSLVGQGQHRSVSHDNASYTTRDNEGDGIQASDMDLSLLMLYGYILYMGRSYSSALSTVLPYFSRTKGLIDPDYFFRAFALAPANPMINLSLALAYIQHAYKRQSDNRQHLIAQGLTFLFSYYDLRIKSSVASEQQEADFNMARTYHMLGLTHLAVPYYQRCLAFRTDRHKVIGDDFAIEAAFALRNIWAADEQMAKVLNITYGYLVI